MSRHLHDVPDPHEFDGRPPPHWVHNCPRCSHLVSRDETAAMGWRAIVANCTDPSHRASAARLMNPCFLGVSGITILLLAVSAMQLLLQPSPSLPPPDPASTPAFQEKLDSDSSLAWWWPLGDHDGRPADGAWSTQETAETSPPASSSVEWRWSVMRWPFSGPRADMIAFPEGENGLTETREENGASWWGIGGAKKENSGDAEGGGSTEGVDSETIGDSGTNRWEVFSMMFGKTVDRAAEEQDAQGGLFPSTWQPEESFKQQAGWEWPSWGPPGEDDGKGKPLEGQEGELSSWMAATRGETLSAGDQPGDGPSVLEWLTVSLGLNKLGEAGERSERHSGDEMTDPVDTWGSILTWFDGEADPSEGAEDPWVTAESLALLLASAKAHSLAAWQRIGQALGEWYQWEAPWRHVTEWSSVLRSSLTDARDTLEDLMSVVMEKLHRIEVGRSLARSSTISAFPQQLSLPDLDTVLVTAVGGSIFLGSSVLYLIVWLASKSVADEAESTRLYHHFLLISLFRERSPLRRLVVDEQSIAFPVCSSVHISVTKCGPPSGLLQSADDSRRAPLPAADFDGLSNAASVASSYRRDPQDDVQTERSEGSVIEGVDDDVASNVASMGGGSTVAVPPSVVDSVPDTEIAAGVGETVDKINSSGRPDPQPASEKHHQRTRIDAPAADRNAAGTRGRPDEGGSLGGLPEALDAHREREGRGTPGRAGATGARRPVYTESGRRGPAHRGEGVEELQELQDSHSRKELKAARLELLPAIDTTRVPQVSMADLGGEFGDSNDDRNWRNPFKNSRNAGVHEASSEEQPHPPGVRENSAEIIRALRGLGTT